MRALLVALLVAIGCGSGFDDPAPSTSPSCDEAATHLARLHADDEAAPSRTAHLSPAAAERHRRSSAARSVSRQRHHVATYTAACLGQSVGEGRTATPTGAPWSDEERLCVAGAEDWRAGLACLGRPALHDAVTGGGR